MRGNLLDYYYLFIFLNSLFSLFVLYVMLNWTIVNVCQILLCMKSAICERSVNFNYVRFHLSYAAETAFGKQKK